MTGGGRWYRFWTRHGGGHQGASELYRFYSAELIAELGDALASELEAAWNDWVAAHQWNNARGGFEHMGELPEAERRRQLDRYRIQLKEARSMLRLLGAVYIH